LIQCVCTPGISLDDVEGCAVTGCAPFVDGEGGANFYQLWAEYCYTFANDGIDLAVQLSGEAAENVMALFNNDFLHIPIPAGVNVPIPAGVNVPVPAGANVPIPSGANVPIPAGANVPIPSGANVPIPAVANVPIPSGVNVPIPSGVRIPLPPVASGVLQGSGIQGSGLGRRA
jgi:hypothetical protein